MVPSIVGFVDSFLVALLVGTMFGIWIGFNPAGLSSATYVELQQHSIRALNTLMPLFGAVCIVVTIVLAAVTKAAGAARGRLVAAVVFLIVAGVVTRFGNQPINRVVMGWSVQAPPGEWASLRDEWWRWHIVRTMSGLVALGLILSTAIAGGGARR